MLEENKPLPEGEEKWRVVLEVLEVLVWLAIIVIGIVYGFVIGIEAFISIVFHVQVDIFGSISDFICDKDGWIRSWPFLAGGSIGVTSLNYFYYLTQHSAFGFTSLLASINLIIFTVISWFIRDAFTGDLGLWSCAMCALITIHTIYLAFSE